MKKSIRKGFTLVELLITIAVMGVLSLMMILSSAESVASANAANIISDMTTIRTAALAYLVDHDEEIDKAGGKFNLNAVSGDVMKYLDPSTLHDNNYQLINMSYNGSFIVDEDRWYVWCEVTDGRVKKKLQQRAKSLNLLNTAEVDVWYMKNVVPYSESPGKYVGMQIY